ncbi:putative carboxypeptidase Y inhibitor [Calycina marina]|uniref:Carboxypeptidase Y inhibitor n=1 Tax=Calycina marina TaxID=1763456 RepID=A0A9P8CFD3_9HELO|nr:putative carboxypeptidase Y inhibitor [Calycina marina]
MRLYRSMDLRASILVFSLFQLATSLVVNEVPGQVTLSNPKYGAFEEMRKLLKKADIIDGIVDDFTPKCFVSPSYNGIEVEYGSHFNTSDTQNKPAVMISCPKKSFKGLTLVLTDPDAPSRENPKWGEMCHWIATASSTGLKRVVDYKAPEPPAKTGYHRYVFLLLEGENGKLEAPDDRQHWGTGKSGHGVRDWAKAQGLRVVGGNFFFEQNEEQ